MSLNEYSKRRVAVLRTVGCNVSELHYVFKALLDRTLDDFGYDSPQQSELAAAFLDEAKCPSARGLSEEEKAALLKIRDLAPPNPAPTDASAQAAQ